MVKCKDKPELFQNSPMASFIQGKEENLIASLLYSLVTENTLKFHANLFLISKLLNKRSLCLEHNSSSPSVP